MIKYGLISETDARCLEKTIDLICEQFPKETINVLEIGVYNGETGNGVREYFIKKNTNPMILTGIDNEKDKPIENKKPYYNFIIGNSNEVYNQLEDNSQHLIFVDGDHSYIGVISDFYAYCDKVKKGGYFAFHDTGSHIMPFKDFQHGDPSNLGAYINVREALKRIGLFRNMSKGSMSQEIDEYERYIGNNDWELIFDEADPENEAGGICVFKKLY